MLANLLLGEQLFSIPEDHPTCCRSKEWKIPTSQQRKEMQIKTSDTPQCSIDVTLLAHHPQTHSPQHHPINIVQPVRCWPVHTHYVPICVAPLVALGQLGRDPNNAADDNATSTNACPSWRKDIAFMPVY